MEGILSKARALAADALQGQTRGNGHPFIEHADGVARIAAVEIGLGEECQAAVYLHEASRANKELMDEIRREFPQDVCSMVEGLNNISSIRPKDTRLEAENYKKLIVSYSKDPRVVVIKIADRLEVMRSLELFPKTSRERKSLETLLLYIPLAHQLGLYNIKSEMEDIYFRYADVEQYRAISNKLKAGERDRERLTREFIRPLEEQLVAEGISYKLKARTKTAYSIWKKMQAQKVPFEGVYDVFAIRFIIDAPFDDPKREKELCWKVFSLVTETYESDTKRLRDWITVPKPNGYESLHITVKNEEGAFLEVQIRTKRMDEIAESGLASHWSYKGIKKEATLDSWLGSVRKLLENKESVSAFVNSGDGTAMSGDVFVFTPSGELRRLPSGASVLDFAFDIHSNVGIKCAGGVVNGKAVPIRERLKTGDNVEIIKGKNQKPTIDWLNYVVTSKARSKIKSFLKEEEYQKAEEGKEILYSRCQKWKLEMQDEDIAAIMKKHRFASQKELFEAIGDGRIDPMDIKKFVEFRHESHRVEIPQEVAEASEGKEFNSDASNVLVIDAKHIKSLDYKLSRCCSPVYGDDIFGFVTRLDGIKINKISCPNAARLIEQYPYRILRVKWSK